MTGKEPSARRTTHNGKGRFQFAQPALLKAEAGRVQVLRDLVQRDRRGDLAGLNAIEQDLAQLFVHGAEDEVIGLGDANLFGRLLEILRVQIVANGLRPAVGRHLGVE